MINQAARGRLEAICGMAFCALAFICGCGAQQKPKGANDAVLPSDVVLPAGAARPADADATLRSFASAACIQVVDSDRTPYKLRNNVLISNDTDIDRVRKCIRILRCYKLEDGAFAPPSWIKINLLDNKSNVLGSYMLLGRRVLVRESVVMTLADDALFDILCEEAR